MRQIVSDTGPVLHLSEAGALDLLEQLGEIHIPATVDAENHRYLAGWSLHRPVWMTVDTLAPSDASTAAGWVQAGLLHAGEAAAIAFAQRRGADWLLTDDAAARLFARALGLEVHGSLGVVLWSAANGHLNRMDAEHCLDRLSQSSLWVSPGVLAAAKAALNQLTSP